MAEVLTGTQVPLDAAGIANDAAHNNLTARGQDTSLAIANAQLQASAQQAMRQYYLDVAKFGLDRAQLNYQQNMGKIQAQATYNSQLLQAQQGRVSSRMDALKLLGDRSGPQDLVAYNYILNRMGKPTGQTVDPTAFANEIKDPVQPDYSGLNAPLPSEFTAPPPAAAPPQATVTPWNYGTPADQNGKPLPGGNYMGVPNEQVAGYGKGASAYVQTGTAGGSKASDYAGWNVYGDMNGSKGQQLTGDTPIAAGQNIWLQKLSHGTKDGLIRDLAALIGEGTGKKPAKTAEIVVNPTGAPIGVLDPEQTRAAMKHLAKGTKGYAGGTFGETTIPGLAGDSAIPSKAGTYGTPNGGHVTVSNGGGGQGWNTLPHPNESPVPNYWGVPGPGNDGYGTKAPQQNPAYAPPAQGSYSLQPPTKKPAQGGNSIPGIMVNQVAAPQSGGAAAPPVAAPAGSAGAPAQPTYGMPTTNTYTKYDPSVFGNMPAWQKFIGNQRGSDFQGFGATLSNPEFGIQNAPWAINLQNYLGLNPSERDNVQSIYKQGLGIDWRDIYGQALRAAPMGASFGPSSYN